LPDLPEISRYAIARADQIDHGVARHADGWVRALEPAQIERYAARITAIVDEVAAAGGSDVVCEVLSTSPFPLVAVLERHGLGRFRVTQKADLANPADGYRSENARPRDWIMVGTHDTAPLVKVVEGWLAGGTAERRAEYLAERLVLDPQARPAFVASVARDRGTLTQAMFGDLMASPARHVLVFMSDLFGMLDVYNRPGNISADNWGLRIPNDFERAYAANLTSGTAMNVPRALARALRARPDTTVIHAELAGELDLLAPL
jgi:4-alpha-glucanotransferase